MINEEVIRVLDFPENVRRRWSMYIDSANSCLREILDNATDESFTWKGCDQILIDTDFNGYNIVADNGRGIPISMSMDRPGQTQADVSISVLHSGSKFAANGQNATIGTHGVGSACANALAERYFLLSKITQDNYNRSIPEVEKLWNSKGPRSKKNLYYFVEYSKGQKITESAGTLEDIEKYAFQGATKGYQSIPTGYSTIILFKPDPEIWGNTKTELPLQNIRNFLLIQEKFYKRKVTVIANGQIMSGSGFVPYQFEMMKTIIPADRSENPDIKVYITFDIDKSTLGPKQITGSMNGLDCGAGIHVQYAESCFEAALRNEYKIKHRMLTPGLRMFALFLAEEVQYSSQTKERCKSITKVKITDFNDITREFQKIFRANPEYWETHVEVLEKLAESFKNLTASEKAEKLQVGNSVSAAYKLKNELGSKLVDATAGPSERWDTELFLAEDLSASGSLVKGRKSSKYHAIMPLRGRVLNVDGLSVDQMLENKEFYTIFRSIGVGLDVNYVGSDCSSPEEAFEKIKKSSRYGKIIISTDAD
jgi:DNA gyrase subunit B